MLDESRERFRKSYAAGGDAYQRVRDDRRTYIAMVVVICLVHCCLSRSGITPHGH
jgi:hypothetical protein